MKTLYERYALFAELKLNNYTVYKLSEGGKK